MRVVHPIQPNKKARIDAGYLDPRYPQWHPLGSQHPGVDFNIAGTSGHQDLGYPVVAMADGLVRHAKAHRIWGNIVLIEHPAFAKVLGIPYLASQYAHLHQMSVKEGQTIHAGEPVGSIGKGDPRKPYLAHLHFEIRREPLPADAWPHKDVALIKRAYLDPEAFLKEHLAEEWRFTRAGLLLYLPGGKQSFSGNIIVNLEDPSLAQVAVR